MAFGGEINFVETNDGIEMGGTTQNEVAVDEFRFKVGIGGRCNNDGDIDIGGDDAFLFVMAAATFAFGAREFGVTWFDREDADGRGAWINGDMVTDGELREKRNGGRGLMGFSFQKNGSGSTIDGSDKTYRYQA